MLLWPGPPQCDVGAALREWGRPGGLPAVPAGSPGIPGGLLRPGGLSRPRPL